jgi:hypothetical protein
MASHDRAERVQICPAGLKTLGSLRLPTLIAMNSVWSAFSANKGVPQTSQNERATRWPLSETLQKAQGVSLVSLKRGLREQHRVCRGATRNMLAVTAMAGAGHNRLGRNQILDRAAKATPRVRSCSFPHPPAFADFGRRGRSNNNLRCRWRHHLSDLHH